jgi:amidase
VSLPPPLDLPALEQARLIARREISSEELTRLYLSRIETLNPGLHAFVNVWPAAALRSARRRDVMVRRGARLPSFHGVPTGVKDLNLVRGRVTRFGSRAVAFLSPVDCHTTAALRRGGCVLLGKTATSELGAMPVTEPDTHPPTRNPWDPERSAGGSSGGAACAVAAGMLPVAHASDGGGSIRIPSALNHVFGIKPSRGRVRNAYGLDDGHALYTCGPITRTVEDAAALLDVLAGLDVGRPHRLAPPSRPFVELCREPPRRLRVGLWLESAAVPVHPAIREITIGVARLLEEAGHHVEERRAPPITVADFLPIWQRHVADTPVFFPWRLQPVTRWLRNAGRKRRRPEVLALQERVTREVLAMMDGVDILLSPTVGVSTPKVGAWEELPPEEAFAAAAALGAFTAPANVTGAPAASIPAGLLDDRWPVGVQVCGRPGDDALVLAVSRLVEQARPWAHRRPPMRSQPRAHDRTVDVRTRSTAPRRSRS